MTSVALFLVAVIVPVFFASPRTAPMWLSIQALTLAGSVATHHGIHSAHALLSLVEILLVRGLVAPWLLQRTTQHEAAVDHLLPSNLFAWILGVSAASLGFEFAAVAGPTETVFALGAVSATVVLALLLLSFNAAAGAQIFALLLMENAALLLESTLPAPWSMWVHGALTCIYLLTVWVGTRLVREHQNESVRELPSKVL